MTAYDPDISALLRKYLRASIEADAVPDHAPDKAMALLADMRPWVKAMAIQLGSPVAGDWLHFLQRLDTIREE